MKEKLSFTSFLFAALESIRRPVFPPICIAASGLRKTVCGGFGLLTKTETQSDSGSPVTCFLQINRKGH